MGFDAKMEGEAFSAALKAIEGKPGEDPVTQHFLTSMKAIDLSGKAKANKSGTVSERLAFLQQQQEEEFTRTFYVTGDESAKVKSAKTDDELTSLMTSLYAKVGFHVPASFALGAGAEVAKVGDEALGDRYVTESTAEGQKLQEEIKKAQLNGFKAAFA